MATNDLKTPDFTASLHRAKDTLKQHAGIIFVVVVLGALMYSISAVNIVLNTQSDEDYRTKKEAEMTSTQFDRATIQKIEALGDRTNPPAPVLPGGRINPFGE